MARKVLILGGTAEAAALAKQLDADPRLEVTVSLAGATKRPAPLAGRLRVGGFGGVQGLQDYLKGEGMELLVDATHPYAAIMARNASEAAEAAGVPRVKLLRPPWPRVACDRWREARDAEEAARMLPTLGRRVFLATGRKDLDAFSGLTDTHFLVRLVDRPDEPLPLAHCELILGRGPFDEVAERRLLKERAIQVVVSKNSGGAASYPKLAAARALGLPVVMIARPPAPPGPSVPDLTSCMKWVEQRTGPCP